LSARFTWALARYRSRIDVEGAILTFHRIEPALALRALPNPKVLFLHVHPQDLHNPKTEVLWGRAPRLYGWLEQRLIADMTRIYVVREDAAAYYRARYPALAERIAFLPTWVDEEVFVSLPESDRRAEKARLARRHGWDPSQRLVLFVGRFEGQKDPLLLLEAFRRLNGLMSQARLVMIGEGSLEPSIRAFIARRGLSRTVSLLGPQPQPEIAKWMNSADCLALSSAYEGMPMVVLEALRCGLPVVSPDVGEARRLLKGEGVGRLVGERTPQALGKAVADVLRQPPDRRSCQDRTVPYTASTILASVYAAYRRLQASRGV
jgi:glycosyltransferase involved in cell wall biosynthesis